MVLHKEQHTIAMSAMLWQPVWAGNLPQENQKLLSIIKSHDLNELKSKSHVDNVMMTLKWSTGGVSVAEQMSNQLFALWS